jgi:ArsR family transcriptional regulator
MDFPPGCCPACPEFPEPDFFQALGDARRLFLLGRLATAAAPLTVSEAAECCGVHISGASRHLALLRRAGIVRAERSGREVRYALQTHALAQRLRALADQLESVRT